MPTFDGENLLIVFDSGITLVDWIEIYSAWKDWMLSDPLNRRFPPAFTTEGGSTITETIDSGKYWFLRNDFGWRFRPPEENITVYVTGNLIPTDANLPVFVPTVGGYTAAILGLQAITQNVNQDVLAAAVWNHADMAMLLKLIRNKKVVAKSGSVWQLIVYDDNGTTEILKKDLKDPTGQEIADMEAGTLAQELASSV